MASCLALIRTNPSGMTPELISQSRMLLDDVVRPEANELGFDVLSLDPHQFGTNDKELFLMIQSADVMVVDASAKSDDYQYSLGVRHALTDKPTVIFVAGYRPSDVHIPRGIINLGHGTPSVSEVRRKFSEVLQEIITGAHARSFSPIRPALENAPRVFLSYAHADCESVFAVDQWLRSRAVRVDLDERDFIAGRDIREEIVSTIQRAGKVVCFYSADSKDRYYPKLERRLVEEAEAGLHDGATMRNILVFFRLDDTPLPKESSHRLAINAFRMSFDEACTELLRHLLEKSGEARWIDLRQYWAAKPPWLRKGTPRPSKSS